jgi:hypothetical protein
MLANYAWFLENTDRPKAEALRWISDEQVRLDAFERAGRFIADTGELTKRIAEAHGYLRYLIV